MAVAFSSVGPGASSSNSAAALTWSHTVDAAVTVALVAVAMGKSASGGHATWTKACTFGGVAMTEIAAANSNNGNNGFVVLFALLNPPTGASKAISANITKTSVTPTSLIGDSVVYTGAGSWGTPVTGFTTSGGTPSTVVSSATGDMAVSSMCSGSAISGDTQTRRYINNLNGSTSAGNLVISDAAGAASVTFAAAANADVWGRVAVNLIAQQASVPKLWSGSAWVDALLPKLWSGSAWVDTPGPVAL